jgi:hypothetical protein
VNVKLLLDENLSPAVAETLRRTDGVDAVHVEIEVSSKRPTTQFSNGPMPTIASS